MYKVKLHQFAEKLELLGYVKRTIKEYCYEVERFFLYCMQKENVKTIDEITPAIINAWHAHLHFEKFKNDRHLAALTVCHRLTCIKTFYTIMFQERLIKNDYAPCITPPKHRRQIPRNVPGESIIIEFLESIKPDNPVGLRDRTMLELLYATGLRISELLAITLSDTNIADKTLFVTGKGQKDRVVPIGDWVMPWLLEYMEIGRPKLLRKPTDLLFTSNHGRPLFGSNICALIRKYTKAAGITLKISPHGFRHACATHMLKGGADIRYIQELLGHANLSTTQIYTKVDITSLKKVHKQFHPRERQ